MGSFEQDLVLRMIQQLSELVARVVQLKRDRRYGLASREIGDAYRALFGLDRRFLQMMSPASVVAALSHPEKVKAFSQLMTEEADLLRLEGDPQSAASCSRWTLEILREGHVVPADEAMQRVEERLRNIAGSVPPPLR